MTILKDQNSGRGEDNFQKQKKQFVVTENTRVSRSEPKIIQSPAKQGRRQNLKQTPQTFMEVFNLDEVRLAS